MTSVDILTVLFHLMNIVHNFFMVLISPTPKLMNVILEN